MSRRNFTLLIIVLTLIVISVFWVLYSRQSPTISTGDSGGTNFFSMFNPFGKNENTTSENTSTDTPVDVTDETTGNENTVPVLKLNKVSTVPVAGFHIFLKERLKEIPVVTPEITTTETTTTQKKTTKPTPPPTEFAEAVRYVDRQTGNIFQTFLDKLEERKFSITIIPKVYESIFGNKGNSVIMRYLKTDSRTIETFVGGIPKEVLGADTASNEIKGSFLSDNITDLSLSPDTTKVFYLLNVGDSVVGTILNLADNKKSQVFDSPFTEWLSFWPNTNMITLTTKPSARVQGHMYMVNPTTKSFNRVLGDIYGLTTLTSPNGKLVLYSDSELGLNMYDVNKKTSTLVGVRTLPEKCVWGSGSDTVYCAVPSSINAGQYPDDWYQGEVSFTDQIWKIDIATGNTTIISDPTTALGGGEIDAIKLTLDSKGKYLLFVNKKDSILWKLDLI